MEHRLFLLLIFTGVHPFVLSFSRKYFLIQQLKSWSNAQAYCRATYTDLAIINTNEEMNDLRTVAQTQQFSSNAWIGLHTNMNSWRWSMNNETLGSFTAWSTGEPNNFMRVESCVYIAQNQWFDTPCSFVLDFVCFDASNTGNDAYVYITLGKTWSDAQIYCRQHHTDLASVRDATDNSVVGAKNTSGWTWIGLSRDPWKWPDQTTNMSVINWVNGNAYDYILNKNCGFLKNLGQAGVAVCSNTMSFFCFEFSKNQQTIRLKFNSSVDMNDPAIMASIQEKLKKKLEEHGMTKNITVTWRKQPDGEVFHKEEQKTTAVTNTRETCDSGNFVVP